MSTQAISAQCREFWQGRLSLLLSTQNADGQLHTSHAPFAFDEYGNLAVFVSGLATHTHNLFLASERVSQISALLVQDEQDCEQIFARERLSLELFAQAIERDTVQFSEWMMRFEQRFGDIIATLKTLPDFVLFEMKVQKAVYVRGFAQAYEFADGLDSEPSLQKPR